jgi:ABC-type branched-subunit amino acid transport system permease subunit
LFRNLVWVMSFSGVTPTIDYPRFMLVLFGVITFAGYYVLELSVRSPFGRVLRAIRNDERVVTSLGKDPFTYKLQSMVLGSALAGLAGAMAALFFQALVFTQFGPRVTFIALLMVFLGGIGNNRAMVVGALAFWAFQSATTQLADFFPPGQRERIQALRLVVLGLVFLLILYYRPQGLFGRQQLAEVETK